MRTPFRFAAPLFLLVLCAVPTSASAQWRYPPLYPPYYPAYRYAGPDSSLRISVKPKDASVYVDGYFAGKVDDFDGTFQRLRVEPGEHEIVVYLEGFRSLRQRLYLSPNSSRTIDGVLDKLPAGAPNEPQPEPTERDRDRASGPDDGYRQPPRGPVTRRAPADPPPPRRGPRVESRQPSASRYASLSIRVQPGGAVVRIDGERWDGPASNDERLIVQVSEGHHVIEVERDGYERFTTDLDVPAGETTPVNINLRRR